jgi:hypothetical protein
MKRPVFLPATAYRLRRLRDAARLLPLAGLFLLTLPALWSPPGGVGRQVSSDIAYFFAVWAILVVVAALFAAGLSRGRGAVDDD